MSWIKRKWIRLLAYILREKEPPEFTARGWAIGMFYGCTIPFGFQLLLSVPTAVLLRGSKSGATLGTFVTNHFTIFLIYPLQCWLGNWVLELLGCSVVPVAKIVEELRHVGSLWIWTGEFWSALSQLAGQGGGSLLASFFIGGFLIAVVLTPFTYVAVLNIVRTHRAHGHRNSEHARRRGYTRLGDKAE